MKKILIKLISITSIMLIGLISCDNPTNKGFVYSPPTYPIKIEITGSLSGETITANVSEAAWGDTVTLTANLNTDRKVRVSIPGKRATPQLITDDDGSSFFSMPAGNTVVTAEFIDISEFAIGDDGPAGGLIFHVDTTDPLNVVYYEAAPVNWEGDSIWDDPNPETVTRHKDPLIPWGGYGITCNNTTGTAIGTGKANTASLITHSHGSTQNEPEHTAALMVHYADGTGDSTTRRIIGDNNYADWFLPSLEELILMRENLYDYNPSLGEFDGTSYWSSSEYNDNDASRVAFYNTETDSTYQKYQKRPVRPARSFTTN
ncbi:MAG: hypothetical protein JEY91_19285 [Spirochaetaceae bacterium]|nr:hypothetical protein [Spirochaetaceae bacterium]